VHGDFRMSVPPEYLGPFYADCAIAEGSPLCTACNNTNVLSHGFPSSSGVCYKVFALRILSRYHNDISTIIKKTPPRATAMSLGIAYPKKFSFATKIDNKIGIKRLFLNCTNPCHKKTLLLEESSCVDLKTTFPYIILRRSWVLNK